MKSIESAVSRQRAAIARGEVTSWNYGVDATGNAASVLFLLIMQLVWTTYSFARDLVYDLERYIYLVPYRIGMMTETFFVYTSCKWIMSRIFKKICDYQFTTEQ